ncbi:MAG: response regulator transcription factor, partial [Candidatus Saccharibacteria bacterium]
TKPFNPDELLARVKAQLRRSQMPSEYAPSEFVLQFPGLVIDPLHYRVEFNDRIIDLSMKEFQLLYLMAREPERIFSLEELFKLVWGAESHGDTRTVMVHISNLRKKIENATTSLEYIHTIRGRGYQFFVGK